MNEQGPQQPVSQEVMKVKYLQKGESFREGMSRVAGSLTDTEEEFEEFRELLLSQSFLPGGRIMASMGAIKNTTPYNCFVSGEIDDSMLGIMAKAGEAASTLRMGGGLGTDFSSLRPRGDIIASLGSISSGAISFMGIWDAVCSTIMSAGHRRGAMMGTLRVDHPDIEEFIHAKQNETMLCNFNVSVAVTDKFMVAVKNDTDFDLVFKGRVYKTINARNLWDSIMRATYDWAEPGVIFIDRINQCNNLHFQETIYTTNPCAEQPLPPYGACLLGSMNLTKFLIRWDIKGYTFDFDRFTTAIGPVIRAMDNVVDRAVYPLPEQEAEAKNKRRMGIGVTGMANTIETIGHSYGSDEYIKLQDEILETLHEMSYFHSTKLAEEKGAFPKYNSSEFATSDTWDKLSERTQDLIMEHGLRNSHLTSIAPTGTISLAADNVSSGIEPVFLKEVKRTISLSPTQTTEERLVDYAYNQYGTIPKTADQCSVDDHLNVLLGAQKWVDSSVSKTVNVGEEVTFDQFKEIYIKAYHGGAKGCTTFRAAGKRFGILNPVSPEDEAAEQGAACYIDPETGSKTCD